MNDKFLMDYEFAFGEKFSGRGWLRIAKNYYTRYLFWSRAGESARLRLWKAFARHRARRIGIRHGLEIDFSQGHIAGGLKLAHPGQITVNPAAVLFKGCTIGSIRSGRRAGVPRLGSDVVVCTNAVVVGGITIGSDVLIAANAFVDFDVPDHSVVLGNPGTIHHRKHAAADYC